MECVGGSFLLRAGRDTQGAIHTYLNIETYIKVIMVASLLTPLTNGVQDGRIYSNTSMGTFIRVWRKTTRFTTQWHRIEFSSQPDFGKTSIVNIPTKGHLVGRIYFVTELPAGNEYINSVGHALIENAEVRIGGNAVDRLNSQLLEVLDEFYTPIEKTDVVDGLIGRRRSGATITGGQLHIHIPFWFSSNDPHLWYPIDAVNVDTLSVHLQLRAAAGLTSTGAAATSEAHLGDSYLLAEYIYLDNYEANRLRMSPLDYTIPQHTIMPVYNTGGGVDSARIQLRVGNPTKSLFFFARRTGAAHPFANTADPSLAPSVARGWKTAHEPIKEIALTYEGNQTRYHTTFTDMFRIIMPSLECTKSPVSNNYFYYMGFDIGNKERFVSVPCGEANLDRIGGVELRLGLRCGPDGGADYDIYVFAMTYNVLHIYGGRAGILFAY